jgi:hypothetical protein
MPVFTVLERYPDYARQAAGLFSSREKWDLKR